jgi:two-component SAPR family response regulator
MNGADLIPRAVCLQPLLSVLIITAYADVDGLGILPEQVRVLRKPFRRDDLTRTMAEVMRARRPAQAAT